ncbi:MAG: leucine-rich repeat domain-containing protein, partial [Prevotella sp.]|nr:leucine-rich repeat domain-containing protein [Prevotella sp.]
TSLKSIEIPASVTSIDDFAFEGCTSLASISVAEGNPTYDSRKECNAIIETKTNTLLYGCKNTVIPDGVTSIDVAAFAHCTSLKSITIPASVTSIGVAAFADCTRLESITIPASVTSIDSCAFYYCTRLESVEIPASVTYIGGAAFASCTRLASVTIYAPELSEYGWKAFENNASGRKIYVFKNCLETYKAQAQASRMRVDADDIEAITGINLRDNDDNRSLIAAADGNASGALNVTLQGRTLYKDGKWNTLCLPFDVTIAGSVLAGADIRRLSADIVYEGKTTGFDPDGGVLTLNFTPKTGDGAVTDIKAGVPYIVKWASGDDIVNPVFSDVTVSNATTTQSFDGGRVQFIGTYSPETLTGGDSSNLYLGSGNKLYWPSSDKIINAFRGYFHVSSPAAAVRAFVLNFGDEETTGIISTTNFTNYTNSDNAWYDLSGRKLPAKPTQPGLYINNGRKFAIK